MLNKPVMFYALISPLLLIALCATVQVAVGLLLGVWAWVPTMLCFWLVIWLLVRSHSGHSGIWQRFGPARGRLIWSVLAVVAGLLSLHGFLTHWRLLEQWPLIFPWLIFALINPWFEESYWRGLMLDTTACWGKTISLLYSTSWFAISHPLIWGIHSLPLRKVEAVAAVFFVGLLWGLAYQRTGSLRWCVVGHMLANLLGLAALVMLNLYDPTLR